MKKFYLMFVLASLMMAFAAQAQQIAVVNGGTTHVYQTLKDAIDHAEDGSVIYLPGGGISNEDSVKIDRKVTIIGVGHIINNDNADGNTVIGGDLWFNKGSDGSALLGCYLTGNVYIAEDDVVNNVVIKLCNVNSVQVKNSEVYGTVINQNYIRGASWFSQSSVSIYNNIVFAIAEVTNGIIQYNIICGTVGYDKYDKNLLNINTSIIKNNILRGRVVSGNYYGWYDPFSGSGCSTSSNVVVEDYYGKTFGEDPIIISATSGDLFENVNGWSVSPQSNFHFKDTYKQYEAQVGIYAGDGFSEGGVPPVPYIKAKRIAEQTDAAGMLKVQIRVNAGE